MTAAFPLIMENQFAIAMLRQFLDEVQGRAFKRDFMVDFRFVSLGGDGP